MDTKQLRALVREEVERALNEEAVVDCHRKFRRLVEARLGRRFVDQDEAWDTTHSAWTAAVTESGGSKVDADVLKHYVKETADQLQEAHRHMEELTWDQVGQCAPAALQEFQAHQDEYVGYVPTLMEPLEGDSTIDVDGEPWTLTLQSQSEDDPPYQWDPNDNAWVDISRY